MDMSQHAALKAEMANQTKPKTDPPLEAAQVRIALSALGLAIAGLAISAYQFGAIGIAMPALAMVPVCFFMLILITKEGG